MAGPDLFVDPPRFRPRLGGLAGVADIIDDTSGRIDIADAAQWIANPECSTMESTPADCWGSNPLPHPAIKTYEGLLTDTSSKRFTGYLGVQCGLEMRDEYEQRARDGLSARENRFIEGAIYTLYLAPAVSGGSESSLVAAIGAADQAVDNEYAGLGVIWMSRASAVAGAAFGAISRDKDTGVLYTVNGTPIVASGAIDDDDIYYSGATTVRRGKVITTQVVDQTHNEAMALAERSYIVEFDCLRPKKISITTP